MIKKIFKLIKIKYKPKDLNHFGQYSKTNQKIINLFFNKHHNYDIKKLKHEIKTFGVIGHILEGQKLIKFIEKTLKYTEEIKKETKIFIVFYEGFYFGYNIDYNYSQNICYEIKEHNIREFTYIKRYGNDYLEYHDGFGGHEYYRID